MISIGVVCTLGVLTGGPRSKPSICHQVVVASCRPGCEGLAVVAGEHRGGDDRNRGVSVQFLCVFVQEILKLRNIFFLGPFRCLQGLLQGGWQTTHGWVSAPRSGKFETLCHTSHPVTRDHLERLSALRSLPLPRRGSAHNPFLPLPNSQDQGQDTAVALLRCHLPAAGKAHASPTAARARNLQ